MGQNRCPVRLLHSRQARGLHQDCHAVKLGRAESLATACSRPVHLVAGNEAVAVPGFAGFRTSGSEKTSRGALEAESIDS